MLGGGDEGVLLLGGPKACIPYIFVIKCWNWLYRSNWGIRYSYGVSMF